MNIRNFGQDSFVTWTEAELRKEREEDEPDIRPLLGIGTKKNTVYGCQFCGEWTNGLKSYAGFIWCGKCRIVGTRIDAMLKRVNKIETEIFGES